MHQSRFMYFRLGPVVIPDSYHAIHATVISCVLQPPPLMALTLALSAVAPAGCVNYRLCEISSDCFSSLGLTSDHATCAG